MLKKLMNLLFPSLCKACSNVLLQQESVICSECSYLLPLTQHHQMEENEIIKKFYGIIPLEFASSMFYFQKNGLVQHLIHELKYKNQQEIGAFLGNWYAHDLKKWVEKHQITHVIPVPLHKKRMQERGYNQIATFGSALATHLEIEYDDQVLFRSFYSKTQTKKNKNEREKITSSLFSLGKTKFTNPHFLLVDDVLTSGATLEACSKVLLEIPNAKISLVTIAYAAS